MVKIFKPKAVQGLKGKSLNLTIEKLDFSGRGVARYQRKPIFIEQTLPGEKVVATIVEQASKYAVAKLKQVTHASDWRVTPQCPHYKQCGGCDFQHIDESQHLSIKQQKLNELFARAGVNDLPWQDSIVDTLWHYRRKARIGVQYHRDGKAVLGFRSKNSNTVSPIAQCDVLLPELSVLLPSLTHTVNELPFEAIGHIELIVTQFDQAPLITMVIRQLKKVSEQTREIWQSFIATINTRVQIFFDMGKDQALVPLNDNEQLNYRIDDDIDLAFEANNFIQVNETINQKMISQALQWLDLKNTDRVLDLYCGLGNFSLPIAKRAGEVIGIEGVEEMVDKARVNASYNGLTNTSFYAANLNTNWQTAQNQTWLSQSFDKVLLDPARAGAYEACQQLQVLGAQKVVYVSCEPSSLAKDTKVLQDSGYRLEKIAIMEMFGQTKHVETMVLFTR